MLRGSYCLVARVGRVASMLQECDEYATTMLQECREDVTRKLPPWHLAYISGTGFNLHVGCDCGSVLHCRRCDSCVIPVLRMTPRHNGPRGGIAASLQCRTRSNTPAAWYRLRLVLDDGGEEQDRTSPCKSCRGRSV